MASIWTRKFSGVWAVAAVFGGYVWHECRPLPWAVEMTRGTVEACYAEFRSGYEGECRHNIDLKRADETYGTLKEYRLVSVGRGIKNTDYTVTVDVERERGRTREVAHVFTAYLPRTEEKASFIRNLEVEPRNRGVLTGTDAHTRRVTRVKCRRATNA